ncbi:MAG: hypothetical protein EP332_06115 [Bacteroidetes bacterium]|nr:MAG: hypothetical protein EP332_06115 [Bacteroidota bacterium]
MKLKPLIWACLGGSMLFLIAACSQKTLHQAEINRHLYSGDVKGAYAIMNKNPEKWERGKNTLLYYLERGTLAWMLGEHQESKDYFMMSDYFIEDYYRNYANEALALFTNDKVKEYRGENHERILFHYYQMLNFMDMGENENALVQARRLNLELNRLKDRHKNNTKRYSRDAFAYVMIGLCFEANGDAENAFVAYRNAERIYSEDYLTNFKMDPPSQLISDLLRLAYQMGYNADLDHFQKKYKRQYNPQTDRGGNFVFFWNTGLVSIKEENRFEFVIQSVNGDGWVTFYNSDLGLSIPVYISGSNDPNSGFNDLRFIAASLPRMVGRGSLFTSATIELDSNAKQIAMSLAEPVSAIANKELNDRFLEEVGKMLARVTAKKMAEMAARKESEGAGTIIGLLNFFTERADTRSWETLPDQIFYTRQPLSPGQHQVKLNAAGPQANQQFTIPVNMPKYGYFFEGFHTLQPATTGLTR